jgi:hypothetical protein
MAIITASNNAGQPILHHLRAHSNEFKIPFMFQKARCAGKFAGEEHSY